jgi:RimJ/RimL family protein N-acetyltransferase/glycosyltransferase involved in cell wall biosynthesis
MYNVLIRPLREDDAMTSFNWRNDPEVWKFTGRRPDRVITPEIEREWIRKVLSEDNSARFAILVDNTYVGNIQITNIIPAEEGEYHIFIGARDYWGKGIATQASWQIIRYAREKLGLKKLYLTVKPENEAAIRVYRKCGFVIVTDEIRMVCDLSERLIPRVSIFMLAYNHEPYIEESVESILCQKCDFDFEIVIGEDCSTDRTREKIEAFAGLYPGKFRLLLHDRNIGPHANQLAVFKACDGDYVAFCEGDDYWTDSLKLQKQVDYLVNNPEPAMVCTNYKRFYQKTGKFRENCFSQERHGARITFGEYLMDMSSISTATVMIRDKILKSYLSETPEEVINGFIVGDTPLWLYAASRSGIAVMEDETAVYRILNNSACHFKSHEDHYRFVLRGFEMADYFLQRYGNGDHGISEGLERRKLRAALFHGYRTLNRSLAGEAFHKIRAYKLSIRQLASAFLMFAGSRNKVFQQLTAFFLKIKLR